ncbi:ABC transporter substrate-binding protein [Sciscionella marina]|uniref:ABC transporter substrate-binding protein n=1 Tax=Sciscionella marina TaxID=508770 RepID=UPI000361773A|nr:ABC transporter substrate-binding protein [Sciscionella marina]
MRASGRARLSFLLAAFVLAGCAGPPQERAASRGSGNGYPVTVSSCGHSSTLRDRPRRAVALNQGATEIALALGVSGQLAGTSYLDNPLPAKWQAAYAKIPVLAKKYPSKEKLLAGKPDFVYATFSSAYEKDAIGPQSGLDQLGIPSYLSPFGCAEDRLRGALSWSTVYEELTETGKAFGARDKAEQVIARQRAEVTALDKRKPGKGRTAFWYDSGDKAPYAGAGHGGPQLIMSTLGLRNVFADLPGGWADASWEKVVAADPDVIVLSDAGFSTAQEKIARLRQDPALRALEALRHNRFVILPFDESMPGVRLAEGAETVARGLESR